MNFLVQFIKIAILQGACAQLLLGGIHRCGHFSRAFQMTYFFRLVLAAPGGIALRGGCPGAGFFVGGGACIWALFAQCHWGGIFTLGNYFCTILFTVHVQALTQRALFLYSLKTSKYSLKTSKSLWLSDVFKKYKKEMRNEKWINV